MDCSPPGSSVHGILQARILEWVVIPFSNVGVWFPATADSEWPEAVLRCSQRGLQPPRVSLEFPVKGCLVRFSPALPELQFFSYFSSLLSVASGVTKSEFWVVALSTSPGPGIVSSVLEWNVGQITEPSPWQALGSSWRNWCILLSLFLPPSSCLAGKFSHPEIVQLVSELEAERNANIASAASEPRSWDVPYVAALVEQTFQFSVSRFCVLPLLVCWFSQMCLFSIAWTPARNAIQFG